MAASYPHSTLTESITDCNRSLDAALRRRFGVTLKTYKILKAVIQLAAAALAFYVISQGADPLTTFALFTAILVGPEAVETLVANADQTDSE